jgi:hypothetical protein
MSIEKEVSEIPCDECNHKAHVLIQYIGVPANLSSSTSQPIHPFIQKAILKTFTPSKLSQIPLCIECVGKFLKQYPNFRIVKSCNDAILSDKQKVVYGDDGFYLPLTQIELKPDLNDGKWGVCWVPNNIIQDINSIQKRCRSCNKMVDCEGAKAGYPQTDCPYYTHEGHCSSEY